MRKKYEDPLFEFIELRINDQLLTSSQFAPEESIGEEIVDDEP